RTRDYDSMSLEQLGDALEGIMDDAIHGFGFTMKPISGFMGPTFGFVEFLQNEIGPEGPQVVATLLQGFENGTASAGAGLSALAGGRTRARRTAARGGGTEHRSAH